MYPNGKLRPARDAAVFLREFLRAPVLTASVVASSPALARRCASPIPESGDPVVVELGAGTGTITEAIQSRLDGRGRHLAVELNPRLAALLEQRFPAVEVLCAHAVKVAGILAERRLAADVVVSGLPWAAFGPAGSPTLVARLARSMAAGGVLTQLGYPATRWAPPARRQLGDLRATFEEVTITRTVWRNLPPALVYLARRPRARAG